MRCKGFGVAGGLLLIQTEKGGNQMTKQHFITLADRLKDAREPWCHCEPFTQQQIEYLALFCQTQNPRFNRQRWLDYIAGVAGPNGGKRV